MHYPHRVNANLLGDTIHAWAVMEAMALAGRNVSSPSPFQINCRFAELFEGSQCSFSLGDETYFEHSPNVHWYGTLHGQHSRDAYADLFQAKDLDLGILLPIAGIRKQKPYAIICPYSKNHLREWIMDRWPPVIEVLIGYGYQVIVNQDPSRAFLDMPHGVEYVYPPLKDLAFLLRDAVIVIGVDSGHVHLADAMGNFPISLHATTSSTACAPYRHRAYCIDHHKDAWSCPQRYHSAATHPTTLMDSISSDEVIRMIQRVVKS